MSLLSNIFKSDIKKNWQEFAIEIDGEFVDGGFWNSDKVVLKYRNTEITLDITLKQHGRYSKNYTRIICPYVTDGRFNFEISSENTLTYAAKYLGIKDTEVGDIDFDREMYLKSNDKKLLLKFLDSELLKDKIFQAIEGTELVLSINDEHPYFFLKKIPFNILWIQIEIIEAEKDSGLLNFWFNLCKLTLDRLIEIGEAEDISPNI